MDILAPGRDPIVQTEPPRPQSLQRGPARQHRGLCPRLDEAGGQPSAYRSGTDNRNLRLRSSCWFRSVIVASTLTPNPV